MQARGPPRVLEQVQVQAQVQTQVQAQVLEQVPTVQVPTVQIVLVQAQVPEQGRQQGQQRTQALPPSLVLKKTALVLVQELVWAKK